jgi:hypothetical protein
MNLEAANTNTKTLRKHNYNLQQLLTSTFTICTPGSEFRPRHQLQKIFQLHPLWIHATQYLSTGAKLHLKHEPDDQQKQKENEALIQLNNHKKAKLLPHIIQASISADVSYGFAFPILINDINNIPGAMVCPLGIAEQYTLKEDGSRVAKNRLTHDQTFEALDESESVNYLIDKQTYPELIYGFCMRRLLYQILSIRTHYPGEAILLSKFDIKLAFRRISYTGDSAFRCISVFENIAYVQLRMTFGGANCPPTWCAISELMSDLANDILSTTDWDCSKLKWPHQQLVVPPSQNITADRPFAPSLDTLYLPNPRPWGSTDVFVDDIIVAVLNRPDYVSRASAAVPLAVDIISRPYNEHDLPKREHMLALAKLQAEGSLRETQTILGWYIDTRDLTIRLPETKYLAWVTDINDMIQKSKTKYKTLESLLGRLPVVHCSNIIPLGRFYLGTLRRHLVGSKWRTIKLLQRETETLMVWKTILLKASKGININLIVYRRPTNISINDACLTGMGGFSVRFGIAWRTYFPEIQHTSINTIKFIAAIVGVWLEIKHTKDKHASIMAITDNSSAVGWLHSSSFDPDKHPIANTAACKLADLIINNDVQLSYTHNIYPEIKTNWPMPFHDNTIYQTLHSQSLLSSNTPTRFLIIFEYAACRTTSTPGSPGFYIQIHSPGQKNRVRQPKG